MRIYVPADFYTVIYRSFHHPLYKHIRQETYGHKDVGQSGWVTKEELLQFLARIALKPGAMVLDIGSGVTTQVPPWTPSGGPEKRGDFVGTPHSILFRREKAQKERVFRLLFSLLLL